MKLDLKKELEEYRAQAGVFRFLDVRPETLVQTLHVGSYDEEAELLAEMHDEVIPQAGLQLAGKHHEIYLSDPRRVEPAKLRTILRQPVVPRCGG